MNAQVWEMDLRALGPYDSVETIAKAIAKAQAAGLDIIQPFKVEPTDFCRIIRIHQIIGCPKLTVLP